MTARPEDTATVLTLIVAVIQLKRHRRHALGNVRLDLGEQVGYGRETTAPGTFTTALLETMLYEARCRPEHGQTSRRRRLFVDDFFDLFVWYTEASEIFGFQLCYDKQHDEHALTWRSDTGFRHRSVDDGGRSQRQATPWLVPDGFCDSRGILSRFLDECGEVDPDIVDLVVRKLEELECGREL